MDNLLDRYLDGELDDAEAAALLSRLRAEPELAAELRAHERALAALTEASGTPAADFTDRVMARIRTAAVKPIAAEAGAGSWRRTVFGDRAGGWSGWAVAATVALCFAAGFGVARIGIGAGDGVPPRLIADSALMPAPESALMEAQSSARLRTVRLVYVPQDREVASVAVAGDFNGWHPARTPLVQRDGVWSTLLALPPASYEYQFVIDGERWETDPLATGTRDDGFGGTNAVLDLTL